MLVIMLIKKRMYAQSPDIPNRYTRFIILLTFFPSVLHFHQQRIGVPGNHFFTADEFIISYKQLL